VSGKKEENTPEHTLESQRGRRLVKGRAYEGKQAKALHGTVAVVVLQIVD
jgi:hypothetical protein